MGDEKDPLQLAREIADSYRKGGPAPVRKKRRKAPGRQGADRDEPAAIADVVNELIAQQGWTDQLAAQRVFTDWAAIVGAEVASHTQVEGFADQILNVRASSTAWATQLKLLAPRIVARLNEELGDGSVIRIDIRGPQAPSWKKGQRSVPGRGPRDTYG